MSPGNIYRLFPVVKVLRMSTATDRQYLPTQIPQRTQEHPGPPQTDQSSSVQCTLCLVFIPKESRISAIGTCTYSLQAKKAVRQPNLTDGVPAHQYLGVSFPKMQIPVLVFLSPKLQRAPQYPGHPLTLCLHTDYLKQEEVSPFHTQIHRSPTSCSTGFYQPLCHNSEKSLLASASCFSLDHLCQGTQLLTPV